MKLPKLIKPYKNYQRDRQEYREIQSQIKRGTIESTIDITYQQLTLSGSIINYLQEIQEWIFMFMVFPSMIVIVISFIAIVILKCIK